MEHYAFVRSVLAWIASVACPFPVTMPLLYLAYRLREGRVPEDDELRMDNDEVWKRSAMAGAALSATTFAFLFADLVVAKWAGTPPGPVHFVVFLLYVPTAAFLVTYFFAHDDFFAGLSQLTIFLAIPLIVLYLVNAVLGLWAPVVGWFGGWLVPV